MVLQRAREAGWEAGLSLIRNEAGTGSTLGALVTIHQVLDLYSKHQASCANPVQPQSAKMNKDTFRRLVGFLGLNEDSPIQAITPQLLNNWRRAATKEGKFSPVTIQGYILKGRSIFSKDAMAYYAGEGARFDNPFSGMEKSQSAKVPRFRPIPRATLLELRKWADECNNPRWKMILYLALYTGMRRGEIDSMRLSWYDPETRTIDIPAFEGDFRSKGGEGRQVLVPETIDLLAMRKEVFVYDAARLEALRATNPKYPKNLRPTKDHVYMIPAKRLPHRKTTKQRETITYRLGSYIAKLNAALSQGFDCWRGERPLHTLRAQFGSVVAQQFGILEASRLLGHSNITTTAKHYAHLINLPKVSLDMF